MSPPLGDQRATLIAENAELVLRWLELLDTSSQRNVIASMVRRYPLEDLRAMNAHVQEQIKRYSPPERLPFDDPPEPEE